MWGLVVLAACGRWGFDASGTDAQNDALADGVLPDGADEVGRELTLLAGNLDPDTVTFDIVQTLLPEIAVVGESELESAMTGLFVNEKLIVEGAGATGVAALLARKIAMTEKPIAVVVSGANVDVSVIRSLV